MQRTALNHPLKGGRNEYYHMITISALHVMAGALFSGITAWRILGMGQDRLRLGIADQERQRGAILKCATG
jgi:heme/copper-type cytochrome/quinol oxidase subunit 3